MIVREFQDESDDKVEANYARIYIYCFCDKCNDQITTLMTRTIDKIPDYNNISNEQLARMIIRGIKRIDDYLNYHHMARNAGIVINDEHYCKSCWNETKLKTEDFKERIMLLRKA